MAEGLVSQKVQDRDVETRVGQQAQEPEAMAASTSVSTGVSKSAFPESGRREAWATLG